MARRRTGFATYRIHRLSRSTRDRGEAAGRATNASMLHLVSDKLPFYIEEICRSLATRGERTNRRLLRADPTGPTARVRPLLPRHHEESPLGETVGGR